MAGLFALLAAVGAVVVVSLIVAGTALRESTINSAFTCIGVGVVAIIFVATLLAAYPTGESWGVMPAEGLYPAKLVLVGEDGSEYADEVFLMLRLRGRDNNIFFSNPEPIKFYRVPKSRFVDPDSLVSSDEIVEVAVFYSLEQNQRMVKVVPQAP